jgi:catechol 2,3-dioxygenase-like lactoylglutathione lyase family enzyme
MIRGVKISSIPVRNQDASLKFYTEVLGFRVVTDQPFDGKQRWIELLIPGAEPGLHCLRQKATRIVSVVSAHDIWCDDVFATAKILKSKGVRFAQEPKTEVWGTVGIFKDLDGNDFVLSSK